ncbi:MAG: hypothetical protein JO322_07385 [Candidatus Eremiobacteraeota bacterium]|nr:hypothetical protein [Candidatus Eremiobacteraeota bacterium]
MSLLRLTPGFLALALLAAFAAPAGADQVLSTVSTGPVHTYPTTAPYPLGDLYYAPCGLYGNYGGGAGYGHSGHGGHNGNTTLTGERFYPYDIGSDQNRTRAYHGHGNSLNCYGSRSSPSPRQAIAMPHATP